MSVVGQNVTCLRIRVPARDVAPFLTVSPQSFPSLHTLDLSTGNIKSAQLARLLARFDRIRNMRLDACALLAGREPGEWAALGKDCALTGARRAREREKALKAWREEQLEPAQQQVIPHRSRARAGRKGLATATVSIRGASETVIPTPTRPHPSGASGSETAQSIDPVHLYRKIRINPLPSSLLTLTVTAPPPLPGTDLAPHITALRKEFIEGWEAGINQLRATWTRLHTSARHNVQVMILGPGAEPEAPGLDGLEELNEEGWNALEDGNYPAPIICLAGESENGQYGELHADGCGHRITQAMWGDPRFLRCFT